MQLSQLDGDHAGAITRKTMPLYGGLALPGR